MDIDRFPAIQAGVRTAGRSHAAYSWLSESRIRSYNARISCAPARRRTRGRSGSGGPSQRGRQHNLGDRVLLCRPRGCAIAAARRLRGVRILVWLGVWSGTFGARLLLASTSVTSSLPHSLQRAVPYADVSLSYLLVVFALLAWLELSRGSTAIDSQGTCRCGNGGRRGRHRLVRHDRFPSRLPDLQHPCGRGRTAGPGDGRRREAVVGSVPDPDRSPHPRCRHPRVCARGVVRQPRTFPPPVDDAFAGFGWIRGAAVRLRFCCRADDLRQRAPLAFDRE